MEQVLEYGRAAAAVLGGILGVLLGDVDGMLRALLLFMAADYATGLLHAAQDKAVSSETGYRGLMRKAMILMLVMVGNTVDRYVLGTGAAVRGAVIAFYIANEGISILENTAALGVPYPEKLRAILAQLRNDAEK